jgi:hypothetical protein
MIGAAVGTPARPKIKPAIPPRIAPQRPEPIEMRMPRQRKLQQRLAFEERGRSEMFRGFTVDSSHEDVSG